MKQSEKQDYALLLRQAVLIGPDDGLSWQVRGRAVRDVLARLAEHEASDPLTVEQVKRIGELFAEMRGYLDELREMNEQAGVTPELWTGETQ